jgi:conjugal transfer mating pair stabilization protein TraN
VYGEDFILQDAGGEGTTNQSPPANNCIQQDYRCDSEPEDTCLRVGGSWQCSPYECSAEGQCGNAICVNGTSGDTSNYTPSPLTGISSTVCGSVVCDAVEFENLGMCNGVPACPTAFDIYEINGNCYRDVCPPESTKQELGGDEFRCLMLGCPSGYVESSGNCVTQGQQ